MSEEVEVLYKVSVIKNQLAVLDDKQLVEIFQNKDKYVSFLENLSLLINNDSCFIVLDERYMDKIQRIIQVHRFSFKDPEAVDFINELIFYINSVRAYPNQTKNILKNGYLLYNEEQREAVFNTHTDFINSLATDAIILTALIHGRLDLIRNYDYALMSLNYIMKMCPELFKDEAVRQRAEQIIEKANQNCPTISIKKLRVKKTKKNYMNLNENNML
jgi:hypothetical protein